MKIYYRLSDSKEQILDTEKSIIYTFDIGVLYSIALQSGIKTLIASGETGSKIFNHLLKDVSATNKV